MFIEQEKLLMISQESLVKAGVTEEMIDKLLSEKNIADFSPDSIKHWLGIVDKKDGMKRRNTVQQ
jgi:hypothetical protein